MSNELKKRYNDALNVFIEKIKQDPYVIAVLLAGSLSYDEIWEKSDIDLIIIVEDSKEQFKNHCFTEDDIIINAAIYNRHKFKRMFESEESSSQFHSFLSKASVIYSKDESLTDYFDNMIKCEDNDNTALLLLYGSITIAHLLKAEKWCKIKHDYIYSYFEIQKIIDILAKIELITNNEIPTREAIHRGLELNNSFFHKLYISLPKEEKNSINIENIICMIEKYIEDKSDIIFKDIYQVLNNTDNIIGITELHEKLSKKIGIDKALLVDSFEWLVRKEKIQKSTFQIRITSKSRLQIDEVAYYI